MKVLADIYSDLLRVRNRVREEMPMAQEDEVEVVARLLAEET